MFDLGVAQFDIYLLGGGGQMVLNSGSTSTWTAGGGIGLWMSQHITSRLEIRYNNFTDQIYSGTRNENAVISTLSIGFLL
jgi:opacity protein-like surface antigen